MIAILEMGGSQSMVMNLYRAIDRSKVQFDFIVDHSDRDIELRKEIESLGGKIYRMSTFNGKNILEIKKVWNYFFKSHKEYKILHTHSRSYASIYLPIAKKYGLKTIAHSHSTSNGKGIIAAIKGLMQIPIRYQADYLFACSQEAGDWLFGKKYCRGNKFRILTNAIDESRFAYNAEIRSLMRKKYNCIDNYVIGNVGRMTEPKNQKYLLKLFSKLLATGRKDRLVIVGDGNLENELKAYAADLGISEHVLFVGSTTETQNYYQMMDVFAFPSLWEGLGIAVVEAQASGLKCVVSENVPNVVDIGADLVERKRLNDIEGWIESLESSEYERVSRPLEIRKAGYSVMENAAKLSEFYINLYVCGDNTQI